MDTSIIANSSLEWLETDGFGGFGSGTATGIRCRRYHALLLTAIRPPSGRMVLVNGFDALVETPAGSFELTSQCYYPDVIAGTGAQRIKRFAVEPWPRRILELEDGTCCPFQAWSLGEVVRLDRIVLAESKERSHRKDAGTASSDLKPKQRVPT
jgi:glycogen debranching enzyme